MSSSVILLCEPPDAITLSPISTEPSREGGDVWYILLPSHLWAAPYGAAPYIQYPLATHRRHTSKARSEKGDTVME